MPDTPWERFVTRVRKIDISAWGQVTTIADYINAAVGETVLESLDEKRLALMAKLPTSVAESGTAAIAAIQHIGTDDIKRLTDLYELMMKRIDDKTQANAFVDARRTQHEEDARLFRGIAVGAMVAVLLQADDEWGWQEFCTSYGPFAVLIPYESLFAPPSQ